MVAMQTWRIGSQNGRRIQALGSEAILPRAEVMALGLSFHRPLSLQSTPLKVAHPGEAA